MLFGTDGIRDISKKLIKEGIAQKVGRALATLKRGAVVVIARDTRMSSAELEDRAADGVKQSGGTAVKLGLLPTPALAYTAHRLGADFGVMISASHNPPEYNGIKVFSGDGNKLSEEDERAIEQQIISGDYFDGRGRVLFEPSARKEYAERTARLIDFDFSGQKLYLDCCFGATAGVAVDIFTSLGAKVTALCNEPDGRRVNVGCGSTNVDFLLTKAGKERGYAFDGDGDRVIGVGEGNTFGGDCFLYCLAEDYICRGLLNPQTVVGTKMSNYALISALRGKSVEFITADVGDKHVLKQMQLSGAVLGGEESGHVIVKNEIMTGDGILAAGLFERARLTGVNPRDYKPYPSSLKNYTIDKEILKSDNFRSFIEFERRKIGNAGRIFIRESGTEPVIRVLVEAELAEAVQATATKIEKYVIEYAQKLHKNV